jgi:hypothetical protein
MREHSLHANGRCAGGLLALLALWSCGSFLWAAPPTVKITSPKDGALVISGQLLTVTVDATPFAFQKVFLEGEDPIRTSKMLTAPPYEFQISIPLDFVPGTRMFNAVGVIRPGFTVDSDPITIDIERPDSPRELRTDSRSGLYLNVGHSLTFPIFGVFGDGSEIDLGHSTRTAYLSDNTAVTTVESNGLVTAAGPGSAKITVTNGDAALTIPVIVEGKTSRHPEH